MKKTVKAVILTIILALVTTAAVSGASSPISVTIDGKDVAFPDAKPYILQGRTLVPVRFVSEALGASVVWNNKLRTATITKGQDVITLTIDKTQVLKTGKTITLDVPARITDGRTFVPLRFVSEALGAAVTWNDKTRIVAISSMGAPILVEPPTDTIGTDFDALEGKRDVTAKEKELYTIKAGPNVFFTGETVANITYSDLPINMGSTTVLSVHKDSKKSVFVFEFWSDGKNAKEENGGSEYYDLFRLELKIFLKDGRVFRLTPMFYSEGYLKNFPFYSGFSNIATEEHGTAKGEHRWTNGYELSEFWTGKDMENIKPSMVDKIAVMDRDCDNGQVIVIPVSEIPEI